MKAKGHTELSRSPMHTGHTPQHPLVGGKSPQLCSSRSLLQCVQLSCGETTGIQTDFTQSGSAQYTPIYLITSSLHGERGKRTEWGSSGCLYTEEAFRTASLYQSTPELTESSTSFLGSKDYAEQPWKYSSRLKNQPTNLSSLG